MGVAAGEAYEEKRTDQGYSLREDDAMKDFLDLELLQSPSEALGTPLPLDCFAYIPEGFEAECLVKGTCKEQRSWSRYKRGKLK